MTLLGVIYAQGITHLFLEKVNHSSRKRKAGDTFVTTTVSIGTSTEHFFEERGGESFEKLHGCSRSKKNVERSISLSQQCSYS